MKPYSLFRRIALGLSLTMVVACLCAVTWLFAKAERADDTIRERTLLVQARDIARYLEPAGDDRVQLHLPSSLAEAYSNSESRYRYAISDANGQYLISNSGTVGPLPALSGKRHSFYEYDAGQNHPRHVIGTALRTQVGGRTFYVQVEQRSDRSGSLWKEVTEEFLVDGDWLEFLFLFALIAICLWIVNQGLEPLRKISGIARSIGPTNTHIRFPTAKVPAEILPCILSLNSLLDRLEQGLDRQREFNANAAHQLRTPLAVLMANVQSLGDPEAVARLTVDVNHMSRIVSQLLLTAQLDALAIDLMEVVELNELVADVAANLGPIAIGSNKNVRLERSDADVLLRTNSFALRAAIQNLIENAIKHTPRGTFVLVRVSDLPTVDVIDAGPGVPEAQRAKIFERFWRGDKSTSGAGLGLAIVEKIVKAMRGSVSVTGAPGGGARFTIRLPREALVDNAREQDQRAVADMAVEKPRVKRAARSFWPGLRAARKRQAAGARG